MFSETQKAHMHRANLLEKAANKQHKLLRCPFCGGKAEFVIYYWHHMDQDSIQVECIKCAVCTPYMHFIEAKSDDFDDKASRIYSTSIKDTKCREAIEWAANKWNMRKEFKETKGKKA